jgi:hypothetical protein
LFPSVFVACCIVVVLLHSFCMLFVA